MRYATLSKSKPTLLIDADLYLYRSCVASEEEICWSEEEDIWSLYADLKVAKQIFTEQIDSFCQKLNTSEILMCLSAPDNFRKDVYPLYKSGRKKTRKPLGYRAFVDWCKETYPYHVEPKCEADDVMGYIQSSNKTPTVIVSDDKDLKTISGKLYRPMSDELLEIKPKDADYNWLTQCLVGDSVDGYKGCPRIGEKTAIKVLGNHPTWDLVAQAYIKAGLTKKDAVVQSQLARILRHTDWDTKKNKIKLWKPK
tara:strand:- start:996 stop:1754 length:759 start_codon:yes stop_codon:yes gene_type:complete